MEPELDPVRVLCVIPAGWTDRKAIERALQEVAGEHPDRPLTVVHASEPGKTMLVAHVAHSLGYRPEPRYALWNRDCDYSFCEPEHRIPNRGGRPGTYCPAAGARRDLAMVKAGAALCLEFVLGDPGGDLPAGVLAAMRAGIPIRKVEQVRIPRPRQSSRPAARRHLGEADRRKQRSLW